MFVLVCIRLFEDWLYGVIEYLIHAFVVVFVFWDDFKDEFLLLVVGLINLKFVFIFVHIKLKAFIVHIIFVVDIRFCYGRLERRFKLFFLLFFREDGFLY